MWKAWATFHQASLHWRHNGYDGVSNHQPHHRLLNRLYGRRSKKTSKLRVTGLCVGNSPGTGEFPAQMASNEENVSIWWRHMYMTFIIRLPRWHLWCPSALYQHWCTSNNTGIWMVREHLLFSIYRLYLRYITLLALGKRIGNYDARKYVYFRANVR